MKILEHTSTHLILQDSVAKIWLIRLSGMPFLFFGCIGIFFILRDIFWIFQAIMLGNEIPYLTILMPALQSLRGVIFIVLFCFGGIILVFFSSVNTICFDKTSSKMTLTQKKILRKQVVEYSFDAILNVKIEKKRSSTKPRTLSDFIFLKVAGHSQDIFLFGTDFTRYQKAEEIANLIRAFLSIHQ